MTMSSMKAINIPKLTNSYNLTPQISTKNLTFFSSHVCVAKSVHPSLLLALCTRKQHTQNHSDNTIDENPSSKSNVELNSNPIDPQKGHPKPTYNTSNPSSNSPTPSSRGLIFELGQSGCWDSTEIGSPVVKRFLSDDEERWYMWYYGTSEKNSGCGSIGVAVSSNGVHWERGEQAVESSSGTGVVMTCGEDWWAFDTKNVKPSEIMIMSSDKVRISSAVYWLYYTGFGSESEVVELPQDSSFQLADAANGLEFELGLGRVVKSLPGLAISQDGRYWARIEGDHHSGALFDVGSKGEWDSLFIASPHVVPHSSGDLRMYYHSFDPQEGKFGIGIARSRDGIKWLKLGKIKTIMEQGSSSNEGCFDEMGIMNACVVRDKQVGNYLMAYEGVAKDGKRSIGMAVSEDGLKDWRRVSDKAVLMASSEDGWDSKGVGSPCLVHMKGEEDQWRLYYTGYGVEGRTGIGMAVSQGSDITSFRKWTGFHM